MAADKQARVSVLACVLILGLILLSHASSNVGKDGSNKVADDQGKVTLSLYYESLCPYCANFIVNQLVKVFETDLTSIVNLRMVPWGNTQISPNNSWICQHGPDECLLNMVEACAIHAWPDPEIHFQFIYCIERLHLENRHSEWQSCFSTVGLGSEPIRNCFRSQLEVRLELRYADETARLNPPHRFVPWVLVNNQPLLEDYGNFVTYICRTYRGQKMPRACGSHSFLIKSSKTENSNPNASIVSEDKNTTSTR